MASFDVTQEYCDVNTNGLCDGVNAILVVEINFRGDLMGLGNSADIEAAYQEPNPQVIWGMGG